MMNLRLFDLLSDREPTPVRARHLAYQRGSATSKAAAEKVAAIVPSQMLRVLCWLKARGLEGGTQKEARFALDIERHSLTQRFRGLELDGAIRKTLAVRAGCCVYRANEWA